jgi:hypothetical protein
MMKKAILLLLLLVLTATSAMSATGNWRAYMAYHDISNIVPTSKHIYVLSSNNLFAYTVSDQSVNTFDKVKNLSDSYISFIAYNKSVKKLIVVYSNENIDLIDDNFNITNISDIYSKSTTDDKTINSITIDDIYAYLSTNFGIIKVNMRDAEITNTYNIGRKISSCVIYNNNIYANSSTEGIFIGKKTDNLIDKSNWINITTNAVEKIYNYNGNIIGYTSSNIYLFNTSTNNYSQLINGNYTYLNINDNKMIIGNSSSAYIYNSTTDKSIVNLDGYVNYISYDATNNCYWLNQKDGVLCNSTLSKDTLIPNITNIIPESPRRNYFYSMKWLNTNNTLYVAGGGINDLDRYARPGSIYTYDGNKWFNYDEDSVKAKIGITYYDINHIAIDPTDPNHIFATSGGEGLFEFQDGKFVKRYNNKNSPMHSVIISSDSTENQYYIRVDGATFDSDGNLWFLNSVSKNALLEYTKDKEWKIYNNSEFFYNNGKYSYYTLRNLIIDSRGLFWFVNAHYMGPCLICFDPSTSKATRYSTFTNQDGTTLDITYVRCVNVDNDGNIWVGTNLGPLELTSDQISSGGTTFTQVKIPRNDGTTYADYLLSGVDISCITIDGGNRKWFGTLSNGAYLISADNMDMIHHFLSTNSSLLSDNIESIAINGKTGEVYFGTDKGLASYMSDANDPSSSMTKDNVYAYPNPVKPDFTGLITITGLTNNADIKIVTSNGKKVAEGTSNGGIFTWNGNDMDGKRVASGIYNVVTATSDGSKGTVCKIAMIK